MTKEVELTNKVFESIKHIDSDNNEYWYARELQKALEYKEWRKFENVIKKQKKVVKTVIIMPYIILSAPTKW